MKFYGYFRSSAAHRCRIAFNLKGVTPEFVSVHLRKSEQKREPFIGLNPHGLVPALEIDGHLLTQSLAIIEWLDETHPAPPLLPPAAFDRAHVRALAQSIACDIHPLQNLRVLRELKSSMGQDQVGLDKWCRRWIEPGLAAIEDVIARSGTSGKFCFGNTPTLADICLVPQMYSASRFGVDTTQFTQLGRIMTACDEHPAFVLAHPSLQPDADA
jgi:maleylpyruvate isomerase